MIYEEDFWILKLNFTVSPVRGFLFLSSIRRCRGFQSGNPAASIMLLYFVVCLVMSCQVALEYLLKGPTTSGEQVKAEVKSKLSDEHIKVGDYALTLFCFPFPTAWLGCSSSSLSKQAVVFCWQVSHDTFIVWPRDTMCVCPTSFFVKFLMMEP